jgi:hypothetical protein
MLANRSKKRTHARAFDRQLAAHYRRQRRAWRPTVPRAYLGYPNKYGPGEPIQKRVNLRYVEEFTQSVIVGGAFSGVYYRANDMYDPRQAVGGAQPLGFDQQMNFYQHFTVTGSKITIRPVLDSTSSNTPAYYGVMVVSAATTPPMSTVRECIENSATYGIHGSFQEMERDFEKGITMTFSTRRFFGVKNPVGMSQYRGDISSGPTEQAYFYVWYASVNGNVPDPMTLLVDIQYQATLTEPKKVAGS